MAEITLYNTLTRRKERLDPVVPAKASMYVCGPTVYDRAHIGNARPVVVFDTLFRLLRHAYGEENVTYVRNITDVDDKIIARARETKQPGETELEAIHRITDETIRWYHDDMDALGARRPTFEPRATEHIGDMIAMTALLIERGHAYAAEGHVLFAVASDPDYGKLSRRSLDDMQAGARVEVAPYKRDPMDFVLWKPSTPDQPGWDSPWGRGRPGWHIECSAMARRLLGGTFDIHGGGVDLAFPHHENELAQSSCAHPDEGFARIWMHNGMLNIEGEKMSKSLSNFFTVRDLLDKGIEGQVIRLVLLFSHYRQPLDWTEQKIVQAKTNLSVWQKLIRDARKGGLPIDRHTNPSDDVVGALRDDVNTPAALTCIHELATKVRLGDATAASEFVPSLKLIGLDPETYRIGLHLDAAERALDAVGWGEEDSLGLKIEDWLRRRETARSERNFQLADSIRDGLVTAGVKIMDRPGSQSDWELGPDFDPAKLEALG